MTVETESGGLPVLKSGPYNGNGVTAAFDYDFPVQDETEIEVLRQNADLSVTTLTLTTHYTVSDVGVDAGGQVTIVDPATNLPTGTKLLIRYVGDFLQAVDWSNQSGLQLAQLEAALDKQMMHLRQIKEQLGRTAQTDAFETTNLADLVDAITAVVAISSDIATVAGISANVTTVAGISANVTAVAGIAANITTAAGIASEIATVAGDSADIATLAAIDAEIATLAAIAADITALASGTGGTLTGNWNASGEWRFTGTSALKLPAGTTAQRPGTPEEGDIRKNSTTGNFEAYVDGAWRVVLATDSTLATGDTFYVNASGKVVKLAAGTTGQVLKQGASVPEWGAGGGAWTWLAEDAISAQAVSDFTAFDSASYLAYMFVIEDLLPATDAVDLYLRLSNDAGSTFRAGASDYNFTNHLPLGTTDGAAGGASTSTVRLTDGNAGFIPLTRGSGADQLIGTAAGEDGWTGTITIVNPHNAKKTRVRTDGIFYASDGSLTPTRCSATCVTAEDNDAVRFLASSGNLASGKITMYGLKNS